MFPKYILAPHVPTPEDVVDRMLRLGAVTSEDVVYDLGCGDGRVVIAAARQFGARGVGVDIEPHWIEESRRNAEHAGVIGLVTFHLQDALTVDLSPASVVMLYLVEWSTSKLEANIRAGVKPGTRVVSHNYGMTDWTPSKSETFVDAGGTARRLHLWIG